MKNKKELIEKMYNIMYNTVDKSIEVKIATFLKEHKQFDPDFMLLLNKDTMQQISDKNALIIANAMAHFKFLNLFDYFTPAEIDSLKNLEFDDKDSDRELMTFHNVFKLDERQYCAVASVAQIAMLQDRGLVIVDPNFQRQTKRERINNSILETVYVNKNRVSEIESSLFKNEEDGAYKFNAIRYNLMLDEGIFPSIRSDGTLHLNPEYKLVCIDGNHRQKAAVKAYSKADDAEKEIFRNKYFVILLTNFSVREVKDTISQEWNVERVSRSSIENMKNSSENEIVNMIRFSERLEPLIANVIGTNGNDNRKFYSIEYMAAAIKCFYGDVKLKSKQQIIANNIINILNYFVKENEDEFEAARNKYKSFRGWKWTQIGIIVLIWISSKSSYWEGVYKKFFNSCEDRFENIKSASSPKVAVRQVKKCCEECLPNV